MDSGKSDEENKPKDKDDSNSKSDDRESKASRSESRAKSRKDRPKSKPDRPKSKAESPKGEKPEEDKDKLNENNDNEKDETEENEDKPDIKERPESKASRPASKAEDKGEDEAPEKTDDRGKTRSKTPGSRRGSTRSRAASRKSISKSPDSRPVTSQDTRPKTSPEEPSDMKLNLPDEEEDTDDPRTPHLTVRNILCEICPQSEESKTSKAEFVCTSCVEKYCVRCAKRHVETPVFAKHVMVAMEPTDEDEAQGLEDFLCTKHKSKNLGFFCHVCQEALCGMCVSFEHGGLQHRLEPVTRLDSNKKVLLLRYEKAVNQNPQKDKESDVQGTNSRPVAQLYWKKETDKDKEDFNDDPHQLCGAADVTFLPDGQVMVASRWSKSVVRFNADGGNPDLVLTHVGSCRLCVIPDNKLAVVDEYKGGLVRIIALNELNKDDHNTPSKAQETCKETQENDRKDEKDKKNDNEIEEEKTRDEEKGRESKMSRKKSGHIEKGDGDDEDNGLKDKNIDDSSDNVKMNGRRADDSLMLVQDWKPRGVQRPCAIAVNKFNQWIISDYEQYNRAMINIYHQDANEKPEEKCVKSFGGQGERDDQFDMPGYVVCDSKGRIIVSDFWTHSIKIFDNRGKFLKKLGKGCGKKDGYITHPKGVCVDDNDNILVVDSGNQRVTEFSSTGEFIRHILTEQDGVLQPEGIAFLKLDTSKNKEESKEDALKTPRRSKNKRTKTPRPSETDSKTIRRLALTMSVGRQYAGLFVYNLVTQQNT